MVFGVIRVIIVDDNAHVRYALKVILDFYQDIELVGEASNGKTALELCERLQPRVVLMDLQMPGMNGVATTKILRKRFPDIRVLLLTSSVEYDLINDALEAGAQAYVTKTANLDLIAEAIRQVATV
jgi:NarL family two-component system response regulator LiaR